MEQQQVKVVGSPSVVVGLIPPSRQPLQEEPRLSQHPPLNGEAHPPGEQQPQAKGR